MRKIGCWLGGAVLLVLAGGCGSDDDGGGGSSGGCRGAAEAVCNKLNSCFPKLIEVLYGSVGTCVTRGELGCNADLSAPGSQTTSADLAVCASAYNQASCDELLDRAPAACRIAGERGDGEACATSAQCQSTRCNTGTSNCGTCAPLAAAGEACGGESGDCADGLICAGTVCAAPVDAGGSCTSTDQCSGSLICKAGVCAVPAAAGEPCAPNPAPNECDLGQGLYCDPASSTCKQAQVANAGESCGIVDNTLVVCAGGSSCTPPGSASGTCAVAPADGAACSTTGPACLLPATCVAGSCQLPNPDSCG